MERVIATDLDGTFLGGSVAQRRALYGWIERHRARVGLVFVTGRSLATVEPLLAGGGDDAVRVPVPDYVIGDVGASIAMVVDGAIVPIDALEAEVRGAWPGHDEVLARFADIAELELQLVPQRGRVSFATAAAAAVEAVRTRAAAMDLDVCYSCDHYLDVLPAGVDKGRALRVLLGWLGVPDDRVLVCGDTLNDLALFGAGLRGVVVGEAEPALVAATTGQADTFHATAAGAGGIAQALTRMFGEEL